MQWEKPQNPSEHSIRGKALAAFAAGHVVGSCVICLVGFARGLAQRHRPAGLNRAHS